LWIPFTIYTFILGLTDDLATKVATGVVDSSMKPKPVQSLTTLPVQSGGKIACSRCIICVNNMSDEITDGYL
jgi:hypothetical protein